MNLSSDKNRLTKSFLLLSTANINISDFLYIAVLPVLCLNIKMHGVTTRIPLILWKSILHLEY